MPDVEIILVLDKSSSMSSCCNETIEAVNSFISEQRKLEGRCYFTLHQFSGNQEVTYKAKNIKHVNPLDSETYKPSGSTSLYDAICIAIKNAEQSSKELDNPMVMVAIMTDGFENTSTKYNMADVNEMIDEKTKLGWDFIFLAANQDAMATGQSLGFSADKSLSFAMSGSGIDNTMDVMNNYYSDVRTGVVSMEANTFSAEDRASAMGDE